MDYKLLAQEVIELLGGKENIATHTHCVTRLRFQIVDRSKIKEEELKEVNGVRGVIDKGGIYQVIIGPDVDKTYVHVKEICGDTTDVVKPTETKEKWYNVVLSYISASIAPTLGVLTFSGFTAVILNLLVMTGLVENTSPTYAIFNTFANAAIYYLPVLVAFGAARYFKCSEISAVMIALMTLHPNFLGAEDLTFFGINLVKVQYNGNILPILLTVPIFAVVERKLNEYLPTLVRNILKPLLSIGLMIPVVLLVTGPIASVLVKALASFLIAFNDYGPISLGLMTLVNPFWL